MKKRKNERVMLFIISIVLIVFGLLFMIFTYIHDEIRYVSAEILLILGGGLFSFLLGSKIKKKMSFRLVTTFSIGVIILLGIIKLIVYNMKYETFNIMISALISVFYSIWLANVSPEEIS